MGELVYQDACFRLMIDQALPEGMQQEDDGTGADDSLGDIREGADARGDDAGDGMPETAAVRRASTKRKGKALHAAY